MCSSCFCFPAPTTHDLTYSKSSINLFWSKLFLTLKYIFNDFFSGYYRSEIARSFALPQLYPEIQSDCSISANSLSKSFAHFLLDYLFFFSSVCCSWWFIYSECYSFVYYLCKCFLPICHLLFNFVCFIMQNLFFNVNQIINFFCISRVTVSYTQWLF